MDDHLVTLFRRSGPEIEDYNTLRYALEQAGGGDALRVLAVTSPVVGDGKTTTAINLAGVLAHRHDARVLLIDGDLRRPSVAGVLGLASNAGQPGFVDAIQDWHLTLDQVVTHLPDVNLWVLTPGTYPNDPFELLRTARVGALLQDARRDYDYVIVDTAPLLLVPDTRILQSWVDGVVLVVSAHRTPRNLLTEALNLITRSKLTGVVFNRDDQPLPAHYGYYGYYGATESRPARPEAAKIGARWPSR
jgi:capsular exopolysaccharide synthesis family protein